MKTPASLVVVKNKYQVVIPQRVRDQLGVSVGDLMEVRAEAGRVTLTPKVALGRDELTPRQRQAIDREVTSGLADVKAGRTYGPFRSAEDMAASIETNLKKPRAPKRR
jgi:AbrB family looped-hinge helix DNA binding protein